MAKRAKRTRILEDSDRGVGIGIDAFGGSVVDPTKNVRELVNAESQKRDELREADRKLLFAKFEYQEKIREAETRRVDDLAALRQSYGTQIDGIRNSYDTRIAEDLRVGVKTTSEQLAAQLVKETTSLSNQIGTMNASFNAQITTLTNTFTNQVAALTASITPRLADLERFRWEVGGKTSVTDPQTTADLMRINATLKLLSESKDVHTGTSIGHQQTTAWIVAGVMGLFAFAGTVIAAVTLFLKH